MSFLYLWRAAGLSAEDAARSFSAVIERQCTLYEQAFGHKVVGRVHQIRSLFIGQIEFDTGVTGWVPWQEAERSGIAWSGVCEQLLDSPLNATAVQQLVDEVATNPKRVARWDGRFALCTWNDHSEHVTLTTAVNDSPTLWYTEGPRGWAAGSRALPLLKLVGREPQIDLAAAGLFVAYGYLAGPTALFRGVNRLHTRQHVVVTPEQVTVQTYLTLSEFLQSGHQPEQWNDLVKQQSERLVERVQRQMQHSSKPQVLLTGGRDSRCIAAAAVAGGYRGSARTSGPSGSADVQIAGQASKALGIVHERDHIRSGQSPVRALLDSEEGLRLWMQTTEGIETVRHAVTFQPFFARALPYPSLPEQVFHGLHGMGGDAMRRGMLEKQGYDLNATADLRFVETAIMEQIPRQLKMYDQVREQLASSFRDVAASASPSTLSFANLFHLFYWQNRALQWGTDGMSVKDLIAWHWTPLLDAELMRSCLHLRHENGTAKKLLEDITVALVPALRDVPYDKQPPTLKSKVKGGVKWALKQAYSHGISVPFVPLGRNARIPVDQDLLEFWETVFFSTGDHVWRELVDEAFVRETIRTRPSSDLLWSLATVELTARATLPVLERAI